MFERVVDDLVWVARVVDFLADTGFFATAPDAFAEARLRRLVPLLEVAELARTVRFDVTFFLDFGVADAERRLAAPPLVFALFVVRLAIRHPRLRRGEVIPKPLSYKR